MAVQRTDLDINDKAARELAIADNRASEIGLEWDVDILKQFEHEEVDLSPFWDERELVSFFARPGGEAPEPKLDQAEALRQKWGIKRGQIWEIGKHRLMCGDATSDEDRNKLQLDLERVDLLFSDPPYGLGAARKEFGGNGVKRHMSGLVKGKCIPKRDYGDSDWDDQPPSPEMIDAMRTWGRHSIIWGGNYFPLPIARCWLVWDKLRGETDYADGEMAWTNLDRAMRIIRFKWNGFLTEDNNPQDERVHPTQKPVAVLKWAIEQAPEDCKTIFDPYAGSGTTLVAAQELRRTCYALEIEPKYIAVALERLSDMGLKPVLANA